MPTPRPSGLIPLLLLALTPGAGAQPDTAARAARQWRQAHENAILAEFTVPIANHDNNQHSFNENIRIRHLWDGIELMSALLAM